MAKYTRTLRELVENKINIFSFDYPIFRESYREVFQDKFIKHFYYREIGVETVGRFIYELDEMLNLIMPYYNKLYESQSLEQRILDNYDVTENYKRNMKGNGKVNTNSTDKSLFSDTPKKKVDIDTVDFVSNVGKDTSVAESTNINEGSEEWSRTMKGNIGVQTDADAVIKYEHSLRNIDIEIFNELEILFMGVF